MPIYNYIAKNEHSETVKGKVEANTKNVAVEVLRSRSLFVVDIKDQGDDLLGQLNNLTSGIKPDDVVNLTRQLSTMVAAGLPLTEAISILEQQGKPAMVKMLGEILRDVESGKTFAESLEQFPKQFNKVYVQLIKAGESAGVLDDVLNRLADNLEKNKEFKAKVKGALIYPVIVVVAMIAVALVMMIFVIPKLTDMYADFGAELPLATQLLISVSDMVAQFWWIVIGGLVGGVVGLRAWGKTKEGARKIGEFIMKIPIYGKLRQKIILTEISRTLSLLLGAGISLIQALFIVADVSDSILYKEEVEAATKKVEKGIPLAQTLVNKDLFPLILSQMISVGEETGKLDEVLLKLSAYFQSESEHEVKNLTTAIEPMIMIVLGVGVALMAVAIIMPIYNLTSQF
jgi:type II secretory pathway component PulF